MPRILVALGLTLASVTLPTTSAGAQASAVPSGTASTRYCLRVDPIIGSRIETIECLTRKEWADLGVDVDQEWAQNGVRVIG